MAKCKGTITIKVNKDEDSYDREYIFVSMELYGKTFNEVSNKFSTYLHDMAVGIESARTGSKAETSIKEITDHY
tara:strand:+ start:1941 stop:2162 length:222 start_codon:yes stop_codon:yes gene_type:complete